MTKRTVMAAWLGPASLHSGPRSVFVCVPEGIDVDSRLDSVLADVVRDGDRVLFASEIADSYEDPVAEYAVSRGLDARSIRDEHVTPDLIVVIVDPYRDSDSALRASALAPRGPFDLVIAELPDPIS